jgi:hypothetical protein
LSVQSGNFYGRREEVGHSEIGEKYVSSSEGLIPAFGSADVYVRDPYDGWFDIQIQQSHLPHEAILAGKLTEMITGICFLLPWFWRSLTTKSKDQVLLIGCFILFTQMVVAIYVHLQPGVPASVLPLGIKAPVIPVIVLLLDLFTALSAWKQMRAEKV